MIRQFIDITRRLHLLRDATLVTLQGYGRILSVKPEKILRAVADAPGPYTDGWVKGCDAGKLGG